MVTVKPTAYKIAALRRAGKYNSKIGEKIFNKMFDEVERQEQIKELARQLNEGYKFMITK